MAALSPSPLALHPDSAVSAALSESRKRVLRGVRNPGFYDDSTIEFRKVSNFECFSGGRLALSTTFRKESKVIVSHFKADMDASLPERTNVEAGMAIGTKADATQLSASLVNKWGTLGSLSHRFNNKYSLKSDFQSAKADLLNVEFQRKGLDCCHAVKLSLTPEGHKLAVSCMQSVSRFASIGGRIETTPVNTLLSATARYKRMFKGPEGEKAHHGSTATLSVNSEGSLSATYTRQYDTHTHLAAEVVTKGTEVAASASGLYTYQTFDLQGKVSPASGLVSCLLEHRHNSSISTIFSGQYGQWTGESKFGFGLKVTL